MDVMFKSISCQQVLEILAFLPGGAAIGASLVQSTALSASEFLGIRIAIAMHWMCNCKISGHRCEEFHGRWQDHC